MKQLLLYILTISLILLLAACQGEAESETQQTTLVELSLQVKVEETTTRGAETESAVGLVPDLEGKMLVLLTKEDGEIDHENAMMLDADLVRYPAPNNGVKIVYNPTVIRYIYVLANIEQHLIAVDGGKITNPATADWSTLLTGKNIGDVQYIMEEQGEKSGSASDKLNPYKVNLFGYVRTISLNQSANNLIIVIRPAISRIEIGGFKGVQRPYIENGVAKTSAPITSFTLEEIFINNTFELMGVDYVTYPKAWQTGASANWDDLSLIAYNWQRGPNSTNNNSIFKDGTYPPRYKTDLTPGYKTSVDIGGDQVRYPSVTNPKHYWSFYVATAQKQNPAYDKDKPENEEGNYRCLGNKITPFLGDKDQVPTDNDRKFYSAMPMIVCRFSDVTILTNSSPAKPEWFNVDENAGWITITKYKDAKTDTIIPCMRPGYVYLIEMIEFSEKDIHSQPITEREGGLFATMQVRNWTEVNIGGNPIPF